MKPLSIHLLLVIKCGIFYFLINSQGGLYLRNQTLINCFLGVVIDINNSIKPELSVMRWCEY